MLSENILFSDLKNKKQFFIIKRFILENIKLFSKIILK